MVFNIVLSRENDTSIISCNRILLQYLGGKHIHYVLDIGDLKMCTQNCTINFYYFLPKPSECITFIMLFHN